jgi:hypothetical protein
MESVRGGIAGWSLLAFGLIYGAWGLLNASGNRQHKHFETYEDGAMYVYEHKHGQVVQPTDRHAVTPWVMFVIFLLGPCEPMIPLLYYPAAKGSWWGTLVLIGVYTFFTLVTMLVMVIFGYYGVSFLNVRSATRYVHALGGLTIFICGVGMVFLEW